MKRFADLHIHTNSSDSTLTTHEVFLCAKEKSLAWISITDHDSTESLKEAEGYSREFGVGLIPGIEISAYYGEEEVHILGYLSDWEDKKFQDTLKEIREARIDRMKQMLDKLSKLGVHLSFEEVKVISSSAAMGRLHLARAMVNNGAVNNIKQAFREYIGHGKPGYVKKFHLSIRDAIQLIRSAKGLAFLAHPGAYRTDLAELIESVQIEGIDGIEAYHTDNTPQENEEYIRLAEKRGLLVTGGSDCHGMNKGRILIGEVAFPAEKAEKIRNHLLHQK